jgi:hypothetical protein
VAYLGVRSIVSNFHTGRHIRLHLRRRLNNRSDSGVNDSSSPTTLKRLNANCLVDQFHLVDSTIYAIKDTHFLLMNSRRIDRPYRRKQHASLQGMFGEQSEESETQFVQLLNKNDPATKNAERPSVYSLKEICGDSSALSVILNTWINHEGSPMK